MMTDPASDPASTNPRRRTSLFSLVVLLLAMVAAGLSIWQWLNTRQLLVQMEQALTQKLELYSATNQQTIAISNRADERSTEAAARAASFEQKLSDFRSQQESLQTLYHELADNHEERIITEAEQLLIIASQQLQLAGNIKPALLALQTADSRLQGVETSQALQLRKAISQDIQRLQSLPQADISSMNLRLEGLIERVNTLPLVSERHPSPETSTVPDSDTNTWRRLTREIWQDIKDMVRLERIDRPEPPLLNPDQSFFLKENIKLRLLAARISLLQRDEPTYRADLKAAETWLQNYFDMRDASTQYVLSVIRELSASTLSIQIPDIGETVSLANRYKLTLDHSDATDAAKPPESNGSPATTTLNSPGKRK